MADKLLQTNLPFLPGNTFVNPAKKNFRKSHILDARAGVTVENVDRPGIGGTPLATQRSTPRPMTSAALYPKSRELNSTVPAWVAFDKQVLRFEGYFQEAVHESRHERYRVHHCTLLFYLEDDTLQVVEKKTSDSGMTQGTFLKRHRVPKDGILDSPTEEYFTVADFNVGCEVTIYSRTFRITAADAFTRNFLNKLGIEVPDDEAPPNDPYTNYRTNTKRLSERATHVVDKQPDTLRQFLENDRRVLRFFALWDDSRSYSGDERFMVVNFFLADDTIEIREMIGANSGRDPTPTFMKRGKLQKDGAELTTLGAKGMNFYGAGDLAIGAVLNVYGRSFLLYDCDAFTKSYYESEFGITDFTPIALPEVQVQSVPREVPPPTGFGSEEDSLACMYSLVPKAPKKPLAQILEKEGQTLRFAATIVGGRKGEEGRAFVVSFHLGDDSVSVFEPPVRNGGRVAGKIVQRTKLYNERAQPRRYFVAQDFYVGAMVEVYAVKYLLGDADEFALRYMEDHAEEFPVANVAEVLARVRDGLRSDPAVAFGELDREGAGWVSAEDFQTALARLGVDLVGHELLTLMRRFDLNGDTRIYYSEMLNAM